MKIAVSEIKLNHIRSVLEEKNVDALLAEIPCLIAIIDSMLNLFEGLAAGLRIVDIRRMFGVIINKKNHSDDEPITENDEDKPEDEKSTPEAGTTSTLTADKKTDESKSVTLSEGNEDDQKKNPNKNKNHPGKAAIKDYPSARQCHHYHTDLKPGDYCSECQGGKLKLSRPRQQILFEGAAPIQPVAHFIYDLVCGLCGMVFRAPLSQPALDEGLGSENRYGFSAISMIVIMKYFSDLPWYRSARLHGMFSINLSPSTQFDQTEKLANVMKPVQDLERLVAAQSDSYMMDDTGHNILSKQSAIIPQRLTGEMVLRDGCHSSIVIAFNKTGHPIVMVKTDIIHAGEWIDEILLAREEGLPKPLVTSDCLFSNKVTTTPVIEIACNQHPRQKFYDDRLNGPKLVQPILDWYREIFNHDTASRDMSPADRLKYHQKYSAPIMDKIVQESRRLLDQKIVTPNSDIGGDCQYILNHEPKLRGFHLYEGAPLSNNLSERIVAYIVLLRKNIHFFKTLVGAAVGDSIFSVGLTAFLSGTNLFEYFKLALRHADDVKKNPENWLPWVFNERFPEHTIKYPDRKRQWPPKVGSAFVAPGLEITGCPTRGPPPDHFNKQGLLIEVT